MFLKLHRYFHSLQLNLQCTLTPFLVVFVDLLPSSSITMGDPPPPLIPLPFSIDDSHSRLSRGITQNFTEYHINFILNFTVPLSFETYPEDFYTIPVIREHQDSYLHYIHAHSLVKIPDEPFFPTLLHLFLPLLKLFLKTSTQPMFTFLSFMYSPLFSKTSPKRIIFHLNLLSHPPLYKHSIKRKPF